VVGWRAYRKAQAINVSFSRFAGFVFPRHHCLPLCFSRLLLGMMRTAQHSVNTRYVEDPVAAGVRPGAGVYQADNEHRVLLHKVQ